jgi:hypothetical protein
MCREGGRITDSESSELEFSKGSCGSLSVPILFIVSVLFDDF